MQVLINSRGVSLSQRNGCFLLKQGERKAHIAPGRVSSIVISNAATVSTQAILLAMEHNIDLLILNHYGDPVGRFWYGKMGRSAYIRRRQLEVSGREEGIRWGLTWLHTKLNNQLTFLKKLRSARPGREALFSNPMRVVEESLQQLYQTNSNIEAVRDEVMGYEAVDQPLTPLMQH